MEGLVRRRKRVENSQQLNSTPHTTLASSPAETQSTVTHCLIVILYTSYIQHSQNQNRVVYIQQASPSCSLVM